MTDVKFKVSSALKTIIGKELITDDFIAIFELVKNSFDAHANKVDITFDGLGTSNSCITIKDNGDGMNYDDIVNKWLFVAYSEKKDKIDYRDKIKSSRMFAGAKGIGRFSCDRLGNDLKIYTKKKGEGNSEWNVLSVQWTKFEENAESEFQNIPAQYTTIKEIAYKTEHGTILEITGLRSEDWNRSKLLLLRRSLERLINPNQENDTSDFQINISAPQEMEEDRRIKKEALKNNTQLEQWQLVNGVVRNFLFESLELKTAQICVEIDGEGKFIKSVLSDRGTLIYELVEKNIYSDTLKNIKIHLFALNRSAKLEFSRRMGLRNRNYGSVFLYKNGFRVHPFGDPDEDKLGIGYRHQQGFFRHLGTRDLSGRIEINGKNEEFKETSSRDGGLIQCKAFDDLKELFLEIALTRLEKFVIDLAQFGTTDGEFPDVSTLAASKNKQMIFDIINKLTQSKNVVSIKYDPDFINILENKSSDSVSALLNNLKRIASEQNDPNISQEVVKAERQLKKTLKS